MDVNHPSYKYRRASPGRRRAPSAPVPPRPWTAGCRIATGGRYRLRRRRQDQQSACRRHPVITSTVPQGPRRGADATLTRPPPCIPHQGQKGPHLDCWSARSISRLCFSTVRSTRISTTCSPARESEPLPVRNPSSPQHKEIRGTMRISEPIPNPRNPFPSRAGEKVPLSSS
jgi:hypothetical protein